MIFENDQFCPPPTQRTWSSLISCIVNVSPETRNLLKGRHHKYWTDQFQNLHIIPKYPKMYFKERSIKEQFQCVISRQLLFSTIADVRRLKAMREVIFLLFSVATTFFSFCFCNSSYQDDGQMFWKAEQAEIKICEYNIY